MKIIDEELLDETSSMARHNSRLRKNYNFHADYDEPVQRMLNALEPGSYIPVHRHTQPVKSETIIVLRGAVATYSFDDQGAITQCRRIAPREGSYGYDIPAGMWHGLLVLEPDTVVVEIKPGPFTPLAPVDLAPWTPAAEDAAGIAEFLQRLTHALNKCY